MLFRGNGKITKLHGFTLNGELYNAKKKIKKKEKKYYIDNSLETVSSATTNVARGRALLPAGSFVTAERSRESRRLIHI